MKLNIYKCNAHPQYKPKSEIIVAHISERRAVEMAEEITQCALSVEKIGSGDYEKPVIIKNTFKNETDTY